MMRHLLTPVTLLLLLVSCNPSDNGKAMTEEIPIVKGQLPLYVQYQESVRSTGILAPSLEVKLSFKTGGIVQDVNVRDGERVTQGKVLVSLNLSEIKAQYSQSEIAMEKATRDFNRATNLYFDSVVTLETLQNARTALEMASAQKKIAAFNLEHSRIIAPANGRIQKVLAEKNEMIAPGQPAVLFATTENDWVVRTSLSDKDIVKFTGGDSASITMDAFPERKFVASVLELGSFADPVTGTFEAELLLHDAHPEFRSGFLARIQLYPSEYLSGLWLPMAAMHDLEDQTGKVFVLDSTIAVERKITTGPIRDGGMIIKGGLEDTAFVITEGSAYLEDGQQVRLNND